MALRHQIFRRIPQDPGGCLGSAGGIAGVDAVFFRVAAVEIYRGDGQGGVRAVVGGFMESAATRAVFSSRGFHGA